MVRSTRYFCLRAFRGCIVTIFLLAGCTFPLIQPPMVKITTARSESQRPESQIEVHMTDEETILEVSSPTGIGEATVELRQEQAPARLILRFHLQGLEQLRFHYGDKAVTLALSSTGHVVTHQRVNQTATQSTIETPLDSSSPYWMDIQILDGDAPDSQVIQVAAPQDFLAGNYKTFHIAWIDFYR